MIGRKKIGEALKTLKGYLWQLAAAMLCVCALGIAGQGRFDRMAYDVFMRFSPRPAASHDIVIVEIDDDSLSRIGQWPWPRTEIAKLLEIILSGSPAAVGVDMFFIEPDRTSPSFLKERLEKDGAAVTIDNVPEGRMDNDGRLAQAIRGHPVALGFIGAEKVELTRNALPKPAAVAIVGDGASDPLEKIEKMKGWQAPLDILQDAASAGFLNVAGGSYLGDSVIRSASLLMNIGGKPYPSLALATLMEAAKAKQFMLETGPDGLSGIRVKDIEIPVGPDGTFMPSFAGGPNSYGYVSAADILEGKTEPAQFRNRVILVGATANSLYDMKETPLTPIMPGVEIHATIIDNILNGERIEAASGFWPESLLTSAFAAAAYLALALLPPLAAILSALGLACLAILFCWGLFCFGIFLSPACAVFGIAILILLMAAQRLWNMREIITLFMPLILNEGNLSGLRKKPSEKREIAILFTDLRGFTTLSENMGDSAALIKFLNSYFEEMAQCALAYGGRVDKYIGDAMMAFWNAPEDMPDYQTRAVLAALSMRGRLAQINRKLRDDYGLKEDVRMGIGICAGEANVGIMGSRGRLDYTCIGDIVNLASRLEGRTKIYGVPVLVGGSVWEKFSGSADIAPDRKRYPDVPAVSPKDVDFNYFGKIMVKGSRAPIMIFQPRISECPLDHLSRRMLGDLADSDGLSCEMINGMIEAEYEKGLRLLADGKFGEAELVFRKISEPSDFREASLMLAGKCREYQENPPENWDGAIAFDEK